MNPKTAVLVVDDDLDFAESMADILEARGFVCQTAGGGAEALEKLKHRTSDWC